MKWRDNVTDIATVLLPHTRNGRWANIHDPIQMNPLKSDLITVFF